jgi:spore germination protein PC
MPIDQYTMNYLNHLSHVIQSFQERLYASEQKIQTLQDEFDRLKNDSKMNVGRIEYKFDQLKIERLEGTLNIGLTPKSGEGLLDDLSVGDQSIQMGNETNPNPNPLRTAMNPITDAVTSRVGRFLQTEALNELKQIEAKLEFPLDDNYRLFIIEDIRKQIPLRISQLVETLRGPSNQTSLPDESDSLENYLFDSIHSEILNGIEQFILKLKSGGVSG